MIIDKVGVGFMAVSLPAVTSSLHERKHTRLTAQRKKILRFVLASSDHPTAEDVYHALKQHMPSLSLATVYRNLHLLAQRGSIREYAFESGVVRYDSRLDLHGHFICEDCHVVSDFDIPEKMCPAHFGAYQMGTVSKGRIDFYGRCRRCSSSSSSF
jgi:Fur family transcriptional regulator, peroxide stress response regulator